ncbi:hypothetical protein [Actinomyces massiliensis]|uniref:hypothetical protein n=1 Tax=Actinomyces massiliensis TaxID=461393 RepID=UPI0028EE2635|nr:hypothetical protein [Actinomyces massiliensis]
MNSIARYWLRMALMDTPEKLLPDHRGSALKAVGRAFSEGGRLLPVLLSEALGEASVRGLSHEQPPRSADAAADAATGAARRRERRRIRNSGRSAQGCKKYSSTIKPWK